VETIIQAVSPLLGTGADWRQRRALLPKQPLQQEPTRQQLPARPQVLQRAWLRPMPQPRQEQRQRLGHDGIGAHQKAQSQRKGG
jgi:hypothetical protein